MKKLSTVTAVAAVLMLALAGTTFAYPTGWTSDKTVTASTGSVDIAVKGATVHLVYENNGVYYRRSTNTGLTWSSAVRLDAGTGSRPRVTAGAGNTVYAAYVGQDRPGALHNEVLVRRSTTSGQTWESGYFAYAGSATDTVEAVDVTHGSVNVSLCWKMNIANHIYIYWSPLGVGPSPAAAPEGSAMAISLHPDGTPPFYQAAAYARDLRCYHSECDGRYVWRSPAARCPRGTSPSSRARDRGASTSSADGETGCFISCCAPSLSPASRTGCSSARPRWWSRAARRAMRTSIPGGRPSGLSAFTQRKEAASSGT